MFFNESTIPRQTTPIFPAGDGGYSQAPVEPVVVVRYKLTVGPTPPENPSTNDIWIDTSA